MKGSRLPGLGTPDVTVCVTACVFASVKQPRVVLYVILSQSLCRKVALCNDRSFCHLLIRVILLVNHQPL